MSATSQSLLQSSRFIPKSHLITVGYTFKTCRSVERADPRAVLIQQVHPVSLDHRPSGVIIRLLGRILFDLPVFDHRADCSIIEFPDAIRIFANRRILEPHLFNISKVTLDSDICKALNFTRSHPDCDDGCFIFHTHHLVVRRVAVELDITHSMLPLWILVRLVVSTLQQF